MTKSAPEHSPLLKAVIVRAGLPVVDMAGLPSFLAGSRHAGLFFSGDWERLVESDDVAAILPELMRLAPGLAIAAVARSAERELQLRYRFNKYPALVLLRGEGYLGALLGMRDWGDYARDIPALLAGETRDPPAYAFPDGCLAHGAPQAAKAAGPAALN